MVALFPEHEFISWLKKPTLVIEGFKLNWNKTFTKKDGTELDYFYCSNKGNLKCKKSAKALKTEDGSFVLYSYTGLHSEGCRPSSAIAAVKKVRDAIKERVLSDPTIKPLAVYNSEVFKVRDTLETDTDKVEFDNMMPAKSAINSSIFKWKREVIPAAPDLIQDIETTGPFFTLESGESMVKFDGNVGGDPRRRILVLSSTKVMKAAAESSSQGVMDATFKVSLIPTHARQIKEFKDIKERGQSRQIFLFEKQS